MIGFSKTGRGESAEQVGCNVSYPVDISTRCDHPVPSTVKLNRCAVQGGPNTHLISSSITIGVFPREQLDGMQRLVNVADEVKQPGQRDCSFIIRRWTA